MSTPLEALHSANDAYHVAVERILRDTSLEDPGAKTRWAAEVNSALVHMARSRDLANKLYGVQE